MACLTIYTVQCRDVASGDTGCFLYDPAHWQRTGEFRAVSPVFPSLVEFFTWDNATNPGRCRACYLERERPLVGFVDIAGGGSYYPTPASVARYLPEGRTAIPAADVTEQQWATVAEMIGSQACARQRAAIAEESARHA